MTKVNENINNLLKFELNKNNIPNNYIIHNSLPPTESLYLGDQCFNIIYIGKHYYIYQIERGIIANIDIFDNIKELINYLSKNIF